MTIYDPRPAPMPRAAYSRMTDRLRAGWAVLQTLLAPVLCLALAALVGWSALAAPGLMSGLDPHSAGFVLERLHQMSVALIWGHLPPRWMPDAAFGLGYPYWSYQGPLAWMAAASLAVLGGGFVGAMKVMWLLLLAAAGLGIWRLVRVHWPHELAGLAAAGTYMAAPYALGSIYLRPDALSELAAYALAPWLLLAVDRAVRRPGAGRLAGLALVGGLLWATDLASAAMLLPALALQLFLSLAELEPSPPRAAGSGHLPMSRPLATPETRGFEGLAHRSRQALAWLELQTWHLRLGSRWTGLLTVTLGLLLGAMLAAWFLLPALFEPHPLLQGEDLSSRFAAASFGAKEWLEVDPVVAYGPASNPARPPFRTGFVQLAMAAIGWVLGLLGSRGERRWSLAWLGLAVLCTFLALDPGGMWSSLPLAYSHWLPWRWLAPQALALALLAAPLGARFASKAPRQQPMSWALVLLALAALLVSGLWRAPRRYLTVDSPTRGDLHAFESFSGILGSTPGATFLPASVSSPPRAAVDTVQGHEGSPRVVPGFGRLDRATWTRREAARQDWQLTISPVERSTLAFPTLAFPGWSAQLASGPAWATGNLEGSGWIEVEIDPADCAAGGRCSLSLRLQRSDLRALSEGLSLLALLWTLALLLMDRRRRWGRSALLMVSSLAVMVIGARLLPSGDIEGPRVLATEAGAWPHARPEGIRFGAVELEDARFRLQGEGGPAGTSLDLAAGDRLELLLDWSPDADASGLRVAAALVSPAEKLEALPDVLARDTQDLGSDEALALVVPDTVSDGLYFVRLDVSDENATSIAAMGSQGESLGQLYLGPMRMRAKPERIEASTTMAQMGDIALMDIATEYREIDEQGWLLATLTWRANRAQVLNHRSRVSLLTAVEELVVAGDAEDGPGVEPAYGLLPTTAWPSETPVVERRWLRLSEALEVDAEYILEVELFDGLTGESLGSGRQIDVRLE